MVQSWMGRKGHEGVERVDRGSKYYQSTLYEVLQEPIKYKNKILKALFSFMMA